MGAGIGFWVINLDELAQDRPLYAIDLLGMDFIWRIILPCSLQFAMLWPLTSYPVWTGFGRSSRPNFANDPIEIETEMAAAIEAWRIAMKLEKMIIVGHSLGGYLSTAYAIRYPEPCVTRYVVDWCLMEFTWCRIYIYIDLIDFSVAHLILADPWGFKEKCAEEGVMGRRHIPFYARVLIRIFEPLNPLWSIRLAGKTMGK